MTGTKHSGRHVVSTAQIALAVLVVALIATPQAQAQLTCSATPLSGCKVAGKTKLAVHNDEVLDKKDKMVWSWRLGETTDIAELGHPISTDEYALCIYDGVSGSPVLVSELYAPIGLLWRPKGNHGYLYKDKSRANYGLQTIRLRAGDNGRAKMLVKARGGNTPISPPYDPFFLYAVDPNVTVNLVNSLDVCWESVFPVSTVRKHTRTDFKTNAP